jgi:hypothetical protein
MSYLKDVSNIYFRPKCLSKKIAQNVAIFGLLNHPPFQISQFGLQKVAKMLNPINNFGSKSSLSLTVSVQQ